MSKEILSQDDIKKNVPKWVLSTGYTLLFLSVFINSIGLNLMQINGALTQRIVDKLEKNNHATHEKSLEEIVERLKALEAVSHKPK